MQKIQTISKSKNIDYGNEKVSNFWLKINDKSNFQEENNNLKQIISVFNEIQDSIVCIQTEELNHPKIITSIYNASKRRNRIYILTNEKDKDIKRLEGVCLVRYGIKNIGSFILINPNTSSNKGIIFTAPFIETSLANGENISLELDNEQVKTLFRFFSDNFWNKAEFEIIENFNNPQETGEPPLDFLPNIKDFCDRDFVKNEFSKINSDTIISVPSLQTNDLINLSLLKNSTILTSIKNNDDDLLKTTAKNENSIKAVNLNAIRIIISENNSWLIPKVNISGTDNFFALKLNDNQIDKLDNLINDKINNADFEFYTSKTRKELENKTIRLLENIEDEIVIKQQTEKKLDDLELEELLPKEQFEREELELQDDGVSITINYKWNIIPFFTPRNAKKAKLYEDWEKYQNKYNTFISQIGKIINESESKKVAERLKRFFLSKKQTISKFQQELEEIKETNLSVLEKTKRKNIIQKLNELAKNVSANLSEIDNEIKKSGIETVIEELEKEKEEKENKLSKFIEVEERKIKEKEETKEQKLTEFLKKHNKTKDDLSKFKSELEQKSGKKNGKKNPKEAEEAKKILEELRDIQGFNFRKKFEDDKQKFEKEIKNIESKIQSKQKELAKVGKEQKESTGSSLNFAIGKENNNKNTKQNKEFNIPENIEYLPQVGVLFEVGKQKYLELEFWEDYQTALQEASRLNAKLSAKQL